METKTARKIVVMGNGQQAPFGVGETIETFPATFAGLIKAIRRAHYWYKAATVVIPNGVAAAGWWRAVEYGLRADGTPIVRPKDRGYSLSN